MGGDLNLKKSWHPSLMSNQKKVWEEEKRALEERKKIEQIRKERDEERQIQELQDLQEAAGGKKRHARVDWMYQGPSDGQTGTTEETEAFLLGKRRVDTILQGKEKESLQKTADQDAFMSVQNANTARDTASKIRDDPLLAIKKQEQAAYEAMMSDPVKRKLLLRAAGREEDDDRERKRRKRHHHHHSSRQSERDSDGYRDRSDGRRRSTRDHEHHDSKSRHRRRSRRSPSNSRSPSPVRRTTERSPTQRRRSLSRGSRDRSRSPYRDRRADRILRKAKSWHDSRRRDDSRSHSPSRERATSRQEEDKAAKLAAMQADANTLDAQREQRLQQIAERDRRDIEKDEQARAQTARYGGGRADFVSGYHKRANDLTLSERMGRQRHRHERDDD